MKDPQYTPGGVASAIAATLVIGLTVGSYFASDEKSEGASPIGWLTFAVSVLVFLVGYSQWRTANHRVVLDLRQQRLQVYDQLESAVASIVRTGAVTPTDERQFMKAKSEARFLFGSDVLNYLQGVWSDIAWMSSYNVPTIQQSPNSAMLFQRRTEIMVRLGAFFSDGPEKFAPYIRMDQVNTPFWRPW